MWRALFASGVDTFEINAKQLIHQHQRETARYLFKQPGPRPSSIHAHFGADYDFSRLEVEPWRHAVDCAIETVELAEALDIPILVFHTSAEPILPEERPLRLERAIEGFNLIGQKARSTSRRIAIEYLPRNCLGNNLAELLTLVDRLGGDPFSVCLDVNHLMERHADLPNIVRSLGYRLIATHISDCDEVDEKHWLPGRGVLNWPGFMQALQEINYKGPFTYECSVDGDTVAEKLSKMKDNFNWLSSLI